MKACPSVLMALALVLGACRGEPSGSAAGPGDGSASGPAAVEEGVAGAEAAVPRFTVEGRGESGKTSAVLEVVEGEREVTLSITGADGADNLIVIYAAFDGVESVVGSHRLPIGLVQEAPVFAVTSLGGQVYQSLSGELGVNISADGHADGTFQIALARDEITVVVPGGMAPAPETDLTLAGTFESDWTVTCYSHLVGFTGGHFVSDSPYCNALTF